MLTESATSSRSEASSEEPYAAAATTLITDANEVVAIELVQEEVLAGIGI
jgi:hypothetical protein